MRQTSRTWGLCAFPMKYRRFKKKQTHAKTEFVFLDDVKETEKELGMLLSSSWEFVIENPHLHIKILQSAQQLNELKFILATQKTLQSKVH